MRKFLGWLSILVWAALCLSVSGAAQDQSKTSPPRKTTSSKTSKKSKSRNTGSKTKAGSKSASKKSSTSKSAAKKTSKSRKKAPRTTWRNRQTEPTPERYKEIQDALVAKGFLNPADANGAWGQSSADALKRFQAAQNIESTGKVDSLSLIALGLGPKREAAVSTKATEAQPQSP